MLETIATTRVEMGETTIPAEPDVPSTLAISTGMILGRKENGSTARAEDRSPRTPDWPPRD
jgi:hypothetical protein